MIFFVLSGKVVFFPKNMVFFPGRKMRERVRESEREREDFPQEIHGNMVFSI